MKTFNIKISEAGLKTIQAALDCYSRLGINQFDYCLRYNPKFDKLSWGDKREIEDYLRNKIDSRSFGIYHPEVAEFNEAFQIMKEIQKNIAISDKPVMDHTSNIYDGALYNYDFLPKFYDDAGNKMEHEITIPIPAKHHKKLKNFYDTNKDYEAIWKYIDSHNLTNGIRGNSSRISDCLTKITISKPYTLNKTV